MSNGMDDGAPIRREYPVELAPSGDGRTLELRIIPYNTVARVSDPPHYEPYDEMWLPGAFDRQLSAPNRVDVLVNFEHEQGIGGVVGRGTELRDSPQALDGVFRMLTGPDADKALELVNEGVVRGVSLEAVPLKTVRENGIVKRVKARLLNVALCRTGRRAYEQAAVLAVREQRDEVVEGEPQPQSEPDSPAPDSDEPPAEPPEDAPAEPPSPEPEGEPVAVGADDDGEPEQRMSDADVVLQRLGYEPLLKRAVTKKPWDGSAARFTDEQYKRSCLIDRGGDAPVKERCSLPVLEPNGDLNVNALGAAAGRLNQTQASPELKAQAARKLRRYYSQAGMEPPPNVVAMAGR